MTHPTTIPGLYDRVMAIMRGEAVGVPWDYDFLDAIFSELWDKIRTLDAPATNLDKVLSIERARDRIIHRVGIIVDVFDSTALEQDGTPLVESELSARVATMFTTIKMSRRVSQGAIVTDFSELRDNIKRNILLRFPDLDDPNMLRRKKQVVPISPKHWVDTATYIESYKRR